MIDLREKRKAAGMSQQDIAMKAGLSIATVAQFERGDFGARSPFPSTRRKLAEAYEVTISDIDEFAASHAAEPSAA